MLAAVNTGVGGSADTRTNAVEDLQQAIIRTLNCGIIDDEDDDGTDESSSDLCENSHSGNSNTMPPAWVKAAYLVRSNSLARGYSGVRVHLLDSFVKLLKKNVVPQVPLRGSISASGDLSPLSYLAGALQGNPGIKVRYGEKLVTADIALKQANIPPIQFAPKEGIALVNGTSFSAGVAALALQDAHHLAVFTQLLTAMAVEGLNGTDESFDHHFAQVRPHPGQMEAARNIRHFLKDSKLVRKADGQSYQGLRQDRYALRTAAQWIGPELEALVAAHRQVITECNSITDNPLVVEPGAKVIHGGNFQAMAITSAMDKTRSALQTMGRMLFQQLTELMNPVTNNGLPPNLTADEPSCDFLMKGMDIAAAAYQSELAFLSHSVVPFVMVAEQGNQSLNSLALISARYAHEALDMFMQLCAISLVALCQALDLRAVQHRFFAAFEPVFSSKTSQWVTQHESVQLQASLWRQFRSEFGRLSNMDLSPRMKAVMATLHASAISKNDIHDASFHEDLTRWAESTAAEAVTTFNETLNGHSVSDALPLLGVASRRVYRYVREELEVPFIRGEKAPSSIIPMFKGAKPGTTLGTYTSRVYRALQKGFLVRPVMECLREVVIADKGEGKDMPATATATAIPSETTNQFREFLGKKKCGKRCLTDESSSPVRETQKRRVLEMGAREYRCFG